jgi:TPR repeat protein
MKIAWMFRLGLVVLAIAAYRSPAHAQSADLVLCDRLAADPADPDKPADIKGADVIAPSDIATAIKFCKVAAPSTRRALYELGRAYAANRQMPEAISAYRKAADKGSTSAMVELGVLLATGSGVLKDQAQARELFERAAKAGNPRGVTNLAAVSDNGASPIDPASTRGLLAKAAETNSEAQFQLGLMYANGVGGPQDDVAARALFEKAAAQNHPAALEWAGSFAESGRGGPKDKDAAEADYERAVALGDDNAKAGLRRMRCSIQLSDKKGNPLWTLCSN